VESIHGRFLADAAPDLAELNRITINYVELEDRIRLAGELSHGGVLNVWATRRLLDRLLPVLVTHLEKSVAKGACADSLRSNALQSFAQHAARELSEEQAPVRASAASAQWLAQSVNVSFASGDVCLSFHGDETQCVKLTLEEGKLRQLLNILYEVYRQADWSTDAWPKWVRSAEVPRAGYGARVH